MACEDDITENCDTCYTSSKVECTDITFNVGLTGTYNLNVVGKFNKIYTVEIEVADSFTIDEDDFPDKFFNKYSGAFEIYLTNGSGYTVPLTISGDEYNCILLSITDVQSEDGFESEWIEEGWVEEDWVD